MGLMSFVLLALAIVWILQIIGTWFQMRHYQRILGGITAEGSTGYVGVGNARGRLRKGVILILVVDREQEVTDALRMRGRTVFARFSEAPALVGMRIDELRGEEREGPYEKETMFAARRAVEQIDRIRAEQEVAAEVG